MIYKAPDKKLNFSLGPLIAVVCMMLPTIPGCERAKKRLPASPWEAMIGESDPQRLREVLEKNPKSVDADEIRPDGGNMGPPIFQALISGDERGPSFLKVLLQYNPDLEAKSRDGDRPLAYAVSQGHVEMARLLVQAGADVHARDENGYTPLHEACDKHSPKLETVKLLVEAGADVNAKTNTGYTPLGLLRRSSDTEEVREYLKSKGAVKTDSR